MGANALAHGPLQHISAADNGMPHPAHPGPAAGGLRARHASLDVGYGSSQSSIGYTVPGQAWVSTAGSAADRQRCMQEERQSLPLKATVAGAAAAGGDVEAQDQLAGRDCQQQVEQQQQRKEQQQQQQHSGLHASNSRTALLGVQQKS